MMKSQDGEKDQDLNVSRLETPVFVTFTNVTPDGKSEQEYVICNEATGKFFLANDATVRFFSAIKDTGSVQIALAKSGIMAQHGKLLIKRLIDSGLLVRSGETQSKEEVRASPLESKMISIRWDLIDASRVTRAFGWVGRLLYSPFGYFAWCAIMIAAVLALISNADKAVLAMRQLLDASWGQLALFGLLYVSLKVIHEMGHALAYRTMCLQESIDPGPIRMGISIFAFTPFPFTDVTGAWRIRSIFRRVMIGGGGIYFETWIIAALTLFWAQTQAGVLQTTILQVAVFAGLFALLFNLNPAIKLDGYYMLTDYLRRPNLAGRSSQAARSVVAKAMGAQAPAIVKSDLLYWVLSYGYRWTIFGGIFWLIYQFDPRLAPVAFLIVFLTLVGRPLYNSVKFAIKSGAKPIRSLFVLALSGAAVALCFVPFPDRILIPGQMHHFETTFLEPPEAGRLYQDAGGAITLLNPQLDHQIAEMDIRREMLVNLQRSTASQVGEQARISAELESFNASQLTLIARKAMLNLNDTSGRIWSPMQADAFEGSWVSPSANLTLGSFSTATPAHLLLRLDQSQLETDINLQDDTVLQVRAVHDPLCQFEASLSVNQGDQIIQKEKLILRAFPKQADSCAQTVENGGAVVARLDTQRRSLVDRVKIGGSRLFQNRLPIDLR